MPIPTDSDRARLMLRLSRWFLRCYEAALFVLLIGMAVVVFTPSKAAPAGDVQCGPHTGSR